MKKIKYLVIAAMAIVAISVVSCDKKSVNVDKMNLEELNAAAEDGNGDALVRLGKAYIYGDTILGIERSIDEASECFEKAADLGHPDGTAWYGRTLSATDPAKAFETYKKAAELDSPYGYFLLYLCYKNGGLQGVQCEKDESKAKSYFEKALKADWPDAIAVRGEDYWFGNNGFSKDHKKAFKYWHRAADKETFGMANCYLALRYMYGIEVEEDWARGINYLIRACQQDNINALAEYGELLYENGDKEKALPIFEECCKADIDRAQYYLALMYATGDGVEKNLEKADSLMTLAASVDFRDAKDKLSQIKQLEEMERMQHQMYNYDYGYYGY